MKLFFIIMEGLLIKMNSLSFKESEGQRQVQWLSFD